MRDIRNQDVPASIILFAAAGSIHYTVNVFICMMERRRLCPGIFGAQELWHVFVLGASACHFIVMLFLL
jgi:channel protein (hemolysin III family)